MKIVCIDKNDSEYNSILVIGNEYTVNRIANIGNEVYYQIYIDATKHVLFNSKYFLTLEEYRNRRLKEINI